MVAQTDMEKKERQEVQAEPMHGGRTYRPSVDIVEREDRVQVLADMPGVAASDLDINYERGQLTIHGRVAPRQAGEGLRFVRREYGVGDFHRVFEIGEGIDASAIEARLEHGVLTVDLPKSKELMPRRIEVKGS